jgi:hypothetical protein
MWTAAEVSGAPSTSPSMPKRLPAPIVAIRTTSGLSLRVAPNAIGWTMYAIFAGLVVLAALAWTVQGVRWAATGGGRRLAPAT